MAVLFAVVGLAIGILIPASIAVLSGAPLLGTSGVPPIEPTFAATRASGADPTATPVPSPTATPTSIPTAKPTADTVRPTIIGRTPGPNAVNVAGSSTIRIRFSEPVKSASGSTIELINVSGGWVVRATVGYDSATRTATLTPALHMYPGTEYRVAVLAGITDRAGNRLTPVTWTFRVASS